MKRYFIYKLCLVLIDIKHHLRKAIIKWGIKNNQEKEAKCLIHIVG